MRYIPHFLLLIFLSTQIGLFDTTEIDHAFTPHIKQFIIEAKRRNINPNINYPIMFYDETEVKNRVGVCLTYTDGSKEIQVDRKYWNKITYFEREHLLFHELGHCSFGYKHSQDVSSIMYESVNTVSRKFYIDNREIILNNLFMRGDK